MLGVTTRSQRKAEEQDVEVAYSRTSPNSKASETENRIPFRDVTNEHQNSMEMEMTPIRNLGLPYCVQIHVMYVGTYGVKEGVPIGPISRHLWTQETILEVFGDCFPWMGVPVIVQPLNRREAVMIWSEDRESAQLPRTSIDTIVERLQRVQTYMGRAVRVKAFGLPLSAGWLAVDIARKVNAKRGQKKKADPPQANNNNYSGDESDIESIASSASALQHRASGDATPPFRPVMMVRRSNSPQPSGSRSNNGSARLPPERPVRELPRAPRPQRRYGADMRSVTTNSSDRTTDSERKMRRILRGDALKNPKLPKFGNKENGVTYECWRGRVEMFHKMDNCQDHILINEMLDSLRGTAQELASHAVDPDRGRITVESILTCLDSHLGNVKDMLTLKDEIAAIKMSPTENVSNYSLRLDTAMQRLIKSYPDAMSQEYLLEEKKNRFFHGLRSSFKNALSFRYYNRENDFSDMLRYARQHESETKAAYLNTNRSFVPRKEMDPNQYAFKRHPKGTLNARVTTVKTAVANMVGDPDPDKEEPEEQGSSAESESDLEEEPRELDTSTFPLDHESFDEWHCRLAEVYAANNPAWKAELTCHGCGKKGHFKRECPMKRDIKHEKKTQKPSGNSRPGAAE